MAELFLDFVNLSITAGWLVLAVLLIRFVFPKVPRWILCLLWGLVGLRLICPVSVESLFSLVPSSQTLPETIMLDPIPAIDAGIPAINSAVNPVISETFAPAPGDSANPLQIWIPVAAVFWISGMAAMVLYTAVSYLRLRLRLRTAVRLRDNVYQSEKATSPFVLGMFRPRIYLPFSVEAENLPHVLAHEQAHIRRGDHWWKPLGFFLLSVYWFHPLLWVAYILLCRDIEAACDEKVIASMPKEGRQAYSQALLSSALRRRSIAACPLAFGETGVKGRVRKIMNYKRPAFWVLVTSLLLCAAAAVCFLTEPLNLGVRSVELTEKSPGDITLRIAYGDLHSYSVETVEEAAGEYSGDGMIPYDGALGKYRILIRLGDATAGEGYSRAFRKKYPVGQLHSLPGTSEALRMKLACPDDSTLVMYIGADVPLSVVPTDTVLLEAFRGTILINIRLQESSEVPAASAATDPVPAETEPAFPNKLTLADVIRLNKKGADLKVQDFYGYDCITVKPVIEERRYRIDDTFYVLILPYGVREDDPEAYIRLYSDKGSIDLLTEDAEAFIRSHSEPVQTTAIITEEKLAEVTGIWLFNGATWRETTVTDPEKVEQICSFLAKIAGRGEARIGSSLAAPIYALKLLNGTEEADYISFSVGNWVCHQGAGEDAYGAYPMEGMDIDQVVSFLSGFEEKPFDWFPDWTPVAEPEALTEEDVIRLSKMGYRLTWKELAPYSCEPIDGGYVYPIREGGVLRVLDDDTQGIPKAVYYVAEPIGAQLEIRLAMIENYLEYHTSEAWHRRILTAIGDNYSHALDPQYIHAFSYMYFPNGSTVGTPLHAGNDFYSGVYWDETVYLLVMHKAYRVENGELREAYTQLDPAVLSYYVTDYDDMRLREYRIQHVKEGDLARVLAQFPGSSKLTPEEYKALLESDCDAQAQEQLATII